MADNRAEASRLWAMMNRGGQMGMDVAADPLAYAGGASVVPPLSGAYNPAGAYAEAGRTVPNRVSEQAMAMNQLTQPQGGDPSDLHNWTDPYGRSGAGYPGMGVENRGFPHGITAEGAVDPATGQMRVVPPDTSVVAPPRMQMQTEKQIIDREVMGPSNERDAGFSRLHQAWIDDHPMFSDRSLGEYNINQGNDPQFAGAPGYDTEWGQDIGVTPEQFSLYRAVPDGAKKYLYDNPTDKNLQQFEEKYGFPLDITIAPPEWRERPSGRVS